MTDLTTSAAQDILKDEQNKRSTLSEKLSAGENEKNSVTQQLEQATANFATVEKRNILDEATDAELLEARKVVMDLTMQLEAIDRRIELICEALAEIDQKIATAQKDFELARRAELQQLVAELSTNLNSKLRDQLLEIKAAETFTGVEYGQDWSRFLARIFLAPELNEIILAQDKFCQKHKFSRQ